MLADRYIRTDFTSQEDFEKNFQLNIPEHFHFAYDEVDMIMRVINGELDPDTYVVEYTPDVYINYYQMSLQDIQDWYNTQYLPDTELDLVGMFG